MKYVAVFAGSLQQFKDFASYVSSPDRKQLRYISRIDDIRGIEFSAIL